MIKLDSTTDALFRNDLIDAGFNPSRMDMAYGVVGGEQRYLHTTTAKLFSVWAHMEQKTHNTRRIAQGLMRLAEDEYPEAVRGDYPAIAAAQSVLGGDHD